jgi:hypothetical protein
MTSKKRNKDQEKRRKRAIEHLQPTLKKSHIYPLINGQGWFNPSRESDQFVGHLNFAKNG